MAYVVCHSIWEWVDVWRQLYLRFCNRGVRVALFGKVWRTGRGARRLGDLMRGTCATAAYGASIVKSSDYVALEFGREGVRTFFRHDSLDCYTAQRMLQQVMYKGFRHSILIES
jgi:hypothetical protein